jgi:NAD(P)-dependent dehydrogenase (short-subunit alcohol dehydrogenase family)
MGMLDGRVVIVTGAGRGLGRSHALELASHGATVVVNDAGVDLRGEAAGDGPARDVVSEIEAAGGRAMPDTTSVTDFQGVRMLVERTVDAFGRLDGVVNNAGIVRDKMLTGMTEDDFDLVVAVHLKGTFNLTRHVGEHWRSVAKAGGDVTGRIVNTTSGTGLFGNVGQANYGAAKAAIANLTVISALEMERYGATANAISPLARTRMTESLPSMQAGSGGWDRYSPANSSPVVAWLTSAESGWLSGAVLRIDGNTVQRVQSWQVDGRASYRSRTGERLAADELDKGMRMAFGLLPGGLPSTSITETHQL